MQSPPKTYCSNIKVILPDDLYVRSCIMLMDIVIQTKPFMKV